MFCLLFLIIYHDRYRVKSKILLSLRTGAVSNAEDLELVKKLIDMAMHTKEMDGRRITVEIRMAEQIKKYFDWRDVFLPESILAEQNAYTWKSRVVKALHLKKSGITTRGGGKLCLSMDCT